MQALLENEVVSLYRQESIMSEFDSLMEAAKVADFCLGIDLSENCIALAQKEYETGAL